MQRINKTFGHPLIRATENLLQPETKVKIDKELRERTRSIARGYHICKKGSEALRIFKLTIGSGDLRFDSHVKIDTIFLSGKPVLHIVDVAMNPS